MFVTVAIALAATTALPVPTEVRSDTVSGLIAQLADAKKGREAARQLSRFGRSAVRPLIEALRSENLQVRFYAASALDVMGGERGTKALLRRRADAKEHTLVRRIAARAMGNAGHEPAVRTLIKLASAASETDADSDAGLDDDELRFEVIRALADIGAGESDDILIAALADPSARIRAAAADGLGVNVVIAALMPLRKALADEDDLVVAAAAKALGRLTRRAVAAVPDLIAALDRADVRVRRSCIGSLVLVTGRSYKTPAKWREWWERKSNPSKDADTAAGEGEHVPLPAVDARAILREMRESRRPTSSGSGSDPAGPTPPALRMPWEEEEEESDPPLAGSGATDKGE